MTIHELAQIPENATDKQNPDHAFCGRNYLHAYERHFEALRDRPVKLLEIGVHGGCSLRLWRDYFPKGEIHGLDINPQCMEHEAHRITVHIGDQSDDAVLDALTKLGMWDIIIDDGSHYVPHILKTTQHLWPWLAKGGWYVWEDMRLSYQNVDTTWPGMSFNTTIGDCINQRQPVNDMLLDTVRVLDFCEGETASLHVYPMIYFFEKA